jgi:predicted small secreted protein
MSAPFITFKGKPMPVVRTLRKTSLRSAKTFIMFSVLLGMLAGLAACNTTAGAGRDISNTGKAITGAAQKAAP